MNYEDRVTKEYVEGLLSGGARIAAGSYRGAGAYGSENPNTLTFDFEPKLVLIKSDQNGGSSGLELFYALRPSSYGYRFCGSPVYGACNHITWGARSVSWYTTEPAAHQQMNSNGISYYYIALG